MQEIVRSCLQKIFQMTLKIFTKIIPTIRPQSLPPAWVNLVNVGNYLSRIKWDFCFISSLRDENCNVFQDFSFSAAKATLESLMFVCLRFHDLMDLFWYLKSSEHWNIMINWTHDLKISRFWFCNFQAFQLVSRDKRL